MVQKADPVALCSFTGYKRLDPHPAKPELAFFFLSVAPCFHSSISQNFCLLSSLGLGTTSVLQTFLLAIPLEQLCLGCDSDLQGSCVHFSAQLSALPTTLSSPEGFYAPGWNEFHFGWGWSGLRRKSSSEPKSVKWSFLHRYIRRLKRSSTRTQHGPENKGPGLGFPIFQGLLTDLARAPIRQPHSPGV